MWKGYQLRFSIQLQYVILDLKFYYNWISIPEQTAYDKLLHIEQILYIHKALKSGDYI